MPLILLFLLNISEGCIIRNSRIANVTTDIHTIWRHRNVAYIWRLAAEMLYMTRAKVIPVYLHIDWDRVTDLDLPQKAGQPSTAIIAGNHTAAAIHFLVNGWNGRRIVDPQSIPSHVFIKKVLAISLAFTKIRHVYREL